MDSPSTNTKFNFLKGGGKTGELIRNFNWSATSIGPADKWPVELKNAVRLMLDSPIAICIMWGKDYLQIYNDAFIPSFGQTRHPGAMGKPVKESSQRWPVVEELFKRIWSGETVYHEDSKLLIDKNGFKEECYFNISYVPIYLQDETVGGVQCIALETTDKVRALSAANESANQLKFAIDAADLGTWELNPSTFKFKGNSRLKEWFGLKPEEEIELSLATDIIAEKDRAKVNQAITQALTYESGGNYEVEYTIQNPITKKNIIVKAKGKAYFDEQKKPYTFYGTLQDVTEEAKIKEQLSIELNEQKLVRKKIEESEAHLQLLRNTVPAMIFYLDEQQRYRSYNGVFMNWFKVNATDAIGKTTREFIGEAAYEKAKTYLAKAYAGEQVTYEMHAPSRMDGGKWLSIVYTPHINNDNAIVGIIVHATDITQSKQTEISLRYSESRFRRLIEDAPIATCVFTGKELKIEVANETMLNLWGKDRTILGMNLKDALPHINIKSTLDILNNVFTSGKPHFETAAKRELEINGIKEIFYFNLTYKPLFNEQGEVYGIIDMAVDVTEQILVQKRTEESELFSRDLFYSSPVAKVVYTGIDMIFTRVNENMLNLIGRDNSIVGKKFTDVFTEFSNTTLLDRMKEVFVTGKAYTQPEEKLMLVRYGKPYTGYYSFIYKPLVSAMGEIYGIMVTANEITEQVIARQKIEAKEKELRDLITAAPIGICVVSGDPVMVEEVNERFLQISGKTREQYANAPYWEVLKEVKEIFKPILDSVFKTGIKYTTEENQMVLVRDGVAENIFLTFEYIPVIDSNNIVTKVIVMAVEVTHQVETRKQIEAAVIERTKELDESNLRLKRSNAELEQFAYIASHDLQEPIRKISTFTQMLENSIDGINNKSKDYINKIYSSTDRMTKLIRDVLAFSQISSTIDGFEKVDLSDTIKNIKTDFELLIEQKNAKIEIESMPVIQAIPSQMTQLFSNLLSNSLKYTKPDASPVVKISSSIAKKEKVATHPQLDQKKKYYHIQFSDNGIGFDQEHADRIFKIFQRLHAKTEFEGTGIGLSICRKIVQTHEGHISAAVGANGGAVFNILLPVSI